MPQTPFPPGVPICPRDSEVRWLDPVDAAPNPAEPPPVADARYRVDDTPGKEGDDPGAPSAAPFGGGGHSRAGRRGRP
jgi:hypothetical protein